jgi:hypothetical protein
MGLSADKDVDEVVVPQRLVGDDLVPMMHRPPVDPHERLMLLLQKPQR